MEVQGPEYALSINTLNTNLQLFLSREVTALAGAEDLVEKQNAERGLMPILEDEAATYGYVAEDRHMVNAFRNRARPRETFADGLAVVEILMALYRSAELERTVRLPDPALETYVPQAARSDGGGRV
jgi:predicted dehydrogenase